MTNLRDRYQTQVLRHAVEQATLAPSVHNTQPWRFVIGPDVVEIYADISRHLRALDPTRRQLYISCGCALFNLRVALAADEREIVVERFPDPHQPTLVARVTLTGERTEWTPLARLDAQIGRRRTNRRQFTSDPVSPELRFEVIRAVDEEESVFFEIRTDDQREVIAELSQQADAVQNADPAYRAELRAWTTDDLKRRDGVSAMTVPHVGGRSDDEVPIRDFDTHGRGWLPGHTASRSDQYLVLLGTAKDTPRDWVRMGEALERLWLEVTRYDFVASMLTQVVEVSVTRDLLRRELGLTMHPHLLMRIGRAPTTSATRRRAIDDVLVVSDDAV